MQYESERIEYKSQMIDDIYKEVIAFANTDGGVIYLKYSFFCVCKIFFTGGFCGK